MSGRKRFWHAADGCGCLRFWHGNIPVNKCPGKFRHRWSVTPVPAKHGVCFAQKLVSFHGAARNIIDFFMGFIRIIFDKTQHRTKNNLNFVFPGCRSFFAWNFQVRCMLSVFARNVPLMLISASVSSPSHTRTICCW